MRWYEEIFGDRAWRDAFVTSFTTGILAAVIAMVIGTLLAFMAARGRLVPRSLVATLAMTPMIVPLVVAGIGFYMAYVHTSLYNHITSLALAHAMLGVPFCFLNVLAALTAVDPRVEEAASICGAGKLTVIATVTVPLVLPSAVAGGLFAFVTSWDEVVVATLLATPTLRTLPILFLSQLREGLEPSTSAAATVITLLTIVLLVIAGLLSRRQRGRST
nr:ABC transporter permease [Nocardioides agariphilus]